MKTERRPLSTPQLQTPKAQGYRAGNRRTAQIRLARKCLIVNEEGAGRVQFSGCTYVRLTFAMEHSTSDDISNIYGLKVHFFSETLDPDSAFAFESFFVPESLSFDPESFAESPLPS